MKRITWTPFSAVILAFVATACGGAPTQIQFAPVTFDATQAAFFTQAAAWPTGTPSPSPTPTSAFSPTPIAPSPTPTDTTNPANLPVPVKDQSNWTYYLGSINDISHIAVDPTGRYIWAVAAGGVLQWDVASGASVTYTRTNGLPDNAVTDLAITPDGIVWVGTQNGGLGMYDGSTWKVYTETQGLPDDRISELNVSPTGDLWVGYFNGDVSKFDGKEWESWGQSYGLQKAAPIYIDASDPEQVTVYSDGATVVYNGSLWKPTAEQNAYLTYDSAVTPDGIHWYAVAAGGMKNGESGLLEANAGKQILHNHCSHIRGGNVYSIALDPSGVMWVGTDAGLAKYDGVNWATFTTKDGLPSNVVRAVAVGSDGRVWVGTDHGLAGMGDSPSQWTAFAAQENQPALFTYAVTRLAFDTGNNLWISFGGSLGFTGIARFDGATVVQYTRADLKIGNDVVENILPAPDGSVWVIAGKAILNYQSGEWRLFRAQTDFPLSAIEASAIDSSGRLYLGKGDRIAMRDGGKWKTIAIGGSTFKSPQSLTAMAVTPDGTVWVGSEQGLYEYQNGTWIPFIGSATTTISLLFSASSGDAWMVSGGKVFVYQGGEAWHLFSGGNIFTHPAVAITEGSNSKLYFAMLAQLVVYDGENTQTIGTTDGFPFTLPTALAVGSDQSVWIGTESGLTVYHPG